MNKTLLFRKKYLLFYFTLFFIELSSQIDRQSLNKLFNLTYLHKIY